MFTFETGQRWIYVLLLEQDKVYVGQTDNLITRIKKHGTKHGAGWTNIYKPLNFLKIIDYGVCKEKEILEKENEVTIEMMKEYGWQNVRGGIYSSPDEMKVYQILKTKELPFPIEQPKDTDPKHILQFPKGMNRSKVKLDIFSEFDDVKKATIFASLSGTFGAKTSTDDKLMNLDVEALTEIWLLKNHIKFPGISRDDVFRQFEKLKEHKIKYRLKK